MTARKIAYGFAAACALLAPGVAYGQAEDAFCDVNCYHEQQWFAPVDFDFDCQPIDRGCGYFFNYNRLAWDIGGERVTIGSPGLTAQSEVIFRQNPFDEGTAPPSYTIHNGITDAPPDAEGAWGNRYEFGYFNGDNGWMIGVIEGLEAISQETYGFQELTVPGTLPLFTQANDPNFAPGFTIVGPDGTLPTSGFNLSTTANGFGSVHVNFEAPAGFLTGFRDYHINGPNNEQAPTTGGPGIQLSAVVIVNNQITDITLASGADGITDDLDGDGIAGFGVILADLNGDGTIDDDEVLATFVDFNDLHQFNIRFNTLFVRNNAQADGVELMKTLELDNSHLTEKGQRNHFDVALGARYFRLKDEFFWTGDIDTFGTTFQTTEADNNIVGPQIRARWSHQRHRLTFGLDGRVMFGYNIENLRQRGAIGRLLEPGALNRSATAQPTYVANGRQETEFSPLAELRADVRYRITDVFSARLGYTATFIDNVTRASQVVQYRLPDLGIRAGGQQEIYFGGVDVGFEAVY